ncbi:MAG: hypothetical protein K2Q18_06830, partial [Bdellovibrionales bacterium]|nr:hypothetical protein [Bdellovibrionales bacterium]
SPTNEMLGFPAYNFLTFCKNHGLLQIFNRPQWKTVANGCHTYVKKALSVINKKYLNEAVLVVASEGEKVKVVTTKKEELFDFCFFCTHPPETLKILKNSSESLKSCLSSFKYQKNKAVLHFDESILPSKKSAWSAWNYLSTKSKDGNDAVSVSYLINKLQPLKTQKPVIVTLNPVTEIEPSKVAKIIDYEHPLFSNEAVKSQKIMKSFQGKNKLYYSGAWMRYGFHEDGILSTKEAIKILLEDDGRDAELIKIL